MVAEKTAKMKETSILNLMTSQVMNNFNPPSQLVVLGSVE
jgi:hypothetical protein